MLRNKTLSATNTIGVNTNSEVQYTVCCRSLADGCTLPYLPCNCVPSYQKMDLGLISYVTQLDEFHTGVPEVFQDGGGKSWE